MKNKNKMYLLLGSLVLVLAVVAAVSFNGGAFQGYLRLNRQVAQPTTRTAVRQPASTLRTAAPALKISPVPVAQTIDKPGSVDLIALKVDQSIKVNSLSVAIASAGFVLDTPRLMVNGRDVTNDLDRASLDSMTCSHCLDSGNVNLKLRFQNPIGMDANTDLSLIANVASIGSPNSSIDAKILNFTTVESDGSLKVRPVNNVEAKIVTNIDSTMINTNADYTIMPSDTVDMNATYTSMPVEEATYTSSPIENNNTLDTTYTQR